MAPDGRRFVYRTFGPEGDGLRIMDIETKARHDADDGYDNFPLWSPRGDLIMFSRLADGDYEIYTIKPDGTGVKRLTHATATTRTWRGRRTASTSCSRRRAWDSRTR